MIRKLYFYILNIIKECSWENMCFYVLFSLFFVCFVFTFDSVLVELTPTDSIS